MSLPLDLGDRAALVTMELQRGVVGPTATMAELADAAGSSGTLDRCGELAAAARASGVPVVHARVEWRADRLGTPLNSPLVAALAQNPSQMLRGTEAVEPIAELGDTDADLHSTRSHGLTPFTGTDLDALLRSVDTRTVVACGVSLNVGVLGLVLSAVDLGYRVVLPTDAVCGVPLEYGEMVLRNSLRAVATLTTTAAVIDHWQS